MPTIILIIFKPLKLCEYVYKFNRETQRLLSCTSFMNHIVLKECFKHWEDYNITHYT